MKTIYFLLYTLCLFVCCDPKYSDTCHRTIQFKNNSHDILYVTFVGRYPDTLAVSSNFIYQPQYSKVGIGEINNGAMQIRDCYESSFRNNRFLSDTLMIFVFDAQVVENTPWDTIMKNYMVLKRYDLSREDLGKLDWTITYP